MLKNIYLYNHVNYYERKIIRYETIKEYGNPLAVYTNVNFVLNDGINTTQVLNYDIDTGTPDYALVQDIDYNTFTRWYVIEANRNRKGQCVLTLHRDVIAENLNEVLDATTYVEKGYIRDKSNPIMYTDENINTTLLPASQFSAMESTNQSWIYAYINKTDSSSILSKEISFNLTKPSNIIGTYTTLDAFKLSSGAYYLDSETNTYKVKNLITDAKSSVYINFDQISYSETVTMYIQEYYEYATNSMSYDSSLNIKYASDRNIYVGEYKNATDDFRVQPLNYFYSSYAKILNQNSTFKSTVSNSMSKLISSKYMNQSTLDAYNNKYADKIIAIGTASTGYKYYRIGKIGVTSTTHKSEVYSEKNDELSLAWMDVLESATEGIQYILGANVGSDAVWHQNSTDKTPVYNEFYYTDTLDYGQTELTVSGSVSFTPSASRVSTLSEVYEIWAIPYIKYDGKLSYKNIDSNGNVFRPDINTINTFVSKLTTTYGSKIVLDVQQLPIGPANMSYDPFSHNINLSGLVLNQDYQIVSTSEGSVTFPIIFLSNSNLSDSTTVSFTDNFDEDDSYTYKSKYLTRKYEILSNDHTSKYEIPLFYNNNPKQLRINYTGTLFPYNPYMRADISYTGLNGANVSLCRGLIFSGSYSLTQISDAWTEYQYQNTNYNAIFNSQLDYTKAQQQYAKYNQLTTIATTAIGSSTNIGSTTAMLSGNVGLGLAVGAVAGAASAGAGIIDYVQAEKLRNKTIDYTKDQFNLQLGNIKSLAPTITKLTSINCDNTILPTIIIYKCTDAELEYVKNKLKYNGMTINVIDKLNNYIGPDTTFLKGKIIEIDINEDFNYKNEIANEVNQGFKVVM